MSNDSNEPGSITGYDVPAVEQWIADNTEELAPPFEWTQLEGGHSNLTYALTDQNGVKAVVRRPPMGVLLPKAHDMGREYSIISALGSTDVPVPIAYGYCESPDVTGAHFYVMSQVEGKALFGLEDVEDHLTVEVRANVGKSFMSVLASLHAVDPDDVGLGTLGKKEDYVARQIRTWYRSWQASVEGADYEDPVLHELHDFLTSSIPEQGPARVVHGDYGLHNCLVGRDGNLTAVLDWEISTLGDPLADFAYALNGWVEPGDELFNREDAATIAPGFSTRDELVEWYAGATGADLTNLGYYVSYNHFKTACILHGVYARYMQGQKSSEGVDLEYYRSRIGISIEMSRQAADELR
ncbi:MAG: aminoglycoside phosphotransferase (APT) family kinase protein [Candidatus Poriferisodalaceae bacterium]|jgi:aminoglycoside phosphotransferase (APT) family kinase protein